MKRRTSPRRREAPRFTPEEWEAATSAMLRRCGFRCEKCGDPLDAMERHHRARRTAGGDRLTNLLALHPECHKWITEHPEQARAHGWIVSAYSDPAGVPVRIDGVMWLLDDDGGKACL